MENINYQETIVIPTLQRKLQELTNANLVFEISLLVEQTKNKDMQSFYTSRVNNRNVEDELESKDNVIPIKILAYKAFLIYYAVQSRQKISKKAITAQLRTNPHPLDKYRINIPLSRLKLFRDMYNIKKNDKMFWHNTDTIW